MHIGQSDMGVEKARAILGKEKIIGVTAKTVEQAKAAEAAGADYLGSGAVFGTSTKKDAKPMDHALLQEICESVKIPVVAIGGIDGGNILLLKGRKMAGVAVVSGLFACEDIKKRQKICERKQTGSVNKKIKANSPETERGMHNENENSTYNRRKRFWRRSRYPGGHQDNDGKRCVCDECDHGTDGTEYHKSSRYYGSDTAVSGRAAGLHFYRYPAGCGKTGMVASADLIRTIAGKLTEYQAENIVVDPVMVSTSGARLISEEAIETLKEKLFPLATVITPNIPEAEVLADMEIETVQDMEKAAEVIGTRYGCSVLLKGGHQKNDASDLLWQKDKKPVWFHGVRIDNPNTHGTGCTLSSAIASNLAKGRDLETSVEAAKRYISGALAAMLDLGSGSGPMNHGLR